MRPPVGRWLVTRDGFDFLAYYLSDFDYASHAHGPLGADDVALVRTDAAIQALLDAAGGPDAFLDRYAVILHSDHGQTTVEQAAQLELPLARFADDIVVTASNRAGQVYLLPGRALRGGRPRAEPRRRGRPSRRRCGAKATRPSRAAKARSCASGRPGEAGRRAATRRSSTIPTRSTAAGPRSRIRTPASCSCRRPRAGSSLDIGGRASLGRREPRLARRGRLDRADAHRRRRRGAGPHHRGDARGARALRRRGARSRCASRRPRMPSDLGSADDDGRTPAARARHRRRARARGDGEGAARALRSRGRARACIRGRGAPDRRGTDDLPAVHGRVDLRLPRSCAAASACSTSEPAPAIRRRCSRSSAPTSTRSSACRSSRRPPARRSTRRDTGIASRFRSATARRGCPSTRRSPRSPSRRPPPLCRQPLYEQLAEGGRLVVPVGPRREQRLTAVVRSPEGPAMLLGVPCRFVPLVGSGRPSEHGRVCAASGRTGTMAAWGLSPRYGGAPASRSPARDPARPSRRPPARDRLVARARLRRAVRRRVAAVPAARGLADDRRGDSCRLGADAARGRRRSIAARGTSFRSLLGGEVQPQRSLRRDGFATSCSRTATVTELELDRGGTTGVVRVPAPGSVVVPSRASAA